MRVTQVKVKATALTPPPVLRVTQQRILASVQQDDLENRITSIKVKVSCQKN